MSPFPQGQPCYALVWEGQTGSFYEIDHNVNILEFPQVLANPGYKYALLFDVADPARRFGSWNHTSAGKLMALAAYSKRQPTTSEEDWIIGKILDDVEPPRTDKEAFRNSPFCDCGVTDSAFLQLAGKFSDAMFERFYRYAKANLKKGYPLLISGGCGLNCEWTTHWKESGLFSDVFVPPVTNDSGSAIGTAIEAQYYHDGCAKIRWDVYSGTEFLNNESLKGFSQQPVDYAVLAQDLADGCVVAWVHGRYEIGPRALGHRSLLAAPFDASMRDRLNRIKTREPYRPIAPVCLEEDADELFGLKAPSPYMLEFQKARTDRLQAVTHVDGSARVQTVNRTQNAEIYELLQAFKNLTGFGVLCNTSLNFPGKGFINRGRDLFRYVNERGIEDIVINGTLFRRLSKRRTR
jgi:predicted NodU family carbamoyl transferase